MMCFKLPKLVVETPPVPVERAQISGADLRALLQAKFPNCQNIYISDGDEELLYLCDIADIQAMLKADDTNRAQYKKAVYDCDDFAYRLFGQFNTEAWGGFVIGVMWTEIHAMVWALDCNLDFFY
ncbi:MAG: hypothetical protein KKH61_21090, partial [Gammaproteobacteria bacterium]|nr:hypothetical protein [Gammaproteobacteria bacterium]